MYYILVFKRVKERRGILITQGVTISSSWITRTLCARIYTQYSLKFFDPALCDTRHSLTSTSLAAHILSLSTVFFFLFYFHSLLNRSNIYCVTYFTPADATRSRIAQRSHFTHEKRATVTIIINKNCVFFILITQIIYIGENYMFFFSPPRDIIKREILRG